MHDHPFFTPLFTSYGGTYSFGDHLYPRRGEKGGKVGSKQEIFERSEENTFDSRKGNMGYNGLEPLTSPLSGVRSNQLS